MKGGKKKRKKSDFEIDDLYLKDFCDDKSFKLEYNALPLWNTKVLDDNIKEKDKLDMVSGNEDDDEMKEFERVNKIKEKKRKKYEIENFEIKETILNVIKENELSPLEAIAFIHKIVTKSFLYKENEENPGLCRTIIGCLNTDNIVCVGYSHIVKALVDKLDYQRLKVDTVVFKIVTDDDLNSSISEFMSVGTPHMKNLVFISDEKYGVEGAYLLEATFDSKTKNFTQGRDSPTVNKTL